MPRQLPLGFNCLAGAEDCRTCFPCFGSSINAEFSQSFGCVFSLSPDIHKIKQAPGRCYRTADGFSTAFIILLLVESFFVCLCCEFIFIASMLRRLTIKNALVLYAVWKSHGSVAARGRIAISLSLDDVIDPPVEGRTQSMEASHSRRGWWDYVPTADPSSHRSRRTESIGSHDTSARGGVRGFRSGDRVCDPESSVPSMPPIPPPPLDCNSPPRTSTVRMSTAIQALPNFRRESALIIPRRSSSPAFSSTSRMSRYMPRVALFKGVMRDEVSNVIRHTLSNLICSFSYSTPHLSPLSRSFLSY